MYAESTKLVDGVAITAGNTSPWLNMANFDHCSFTVVFSGGNPIGNLSLQISNDRQSSGSPSGLSDQPRWAAGECNSVNNTKVVNDTANLPNDGFSPSTASVNGVGSYVIEKFFMPSRWIRVVYTPSANSNTTLDIFACRS